MPTPAEDFYQHWEFGEDGCVVLRHIHGQHVGQGGAGIVVAGGKVTVSVIQIREDTHMARFLANRLMEAVAIAEMQTMGALNGIPSST